MSDHGLYSSPGVTEGSYPFLSLVGQIFSLTLLGSGDLSSTPTLRMSTVVSSKGAFKLSSGENITPRGPIAYPAI